MVCGLSPLRADPVSLTRIVAAIVQQGPTSQLPAHLSMVLGLSATEQPVAVKQAVLREGVKVHSFTVRADDHADLVLMDYDELSHITQAYRLTSAGILRKAVNYAAGEAAIEQTGAKARTGLARELKFWTDLQARPAGLQ